MKNIEIKSLVNIKSFITTSICLSLFFLSSFFVNAQDNPLNNLTLKSLVDYFVKIAGGILIPLAIAFLFLVFVLGISKYLISSYKGDAKMVEIAQKRLVKPSIVIFLIFTLWGFLYMFRLFLDGTTTLS